MISLKKCTVIQKHNRIRFALNNHREIGMRDEQMVAYAQDGQVAEEGEVNPVASAATSSQVIRAHLPGIPAWTRLRISNGALEGMNNKVKVIAHRAYGFRKADTYLTAVYHCCADLPL